ncbi:MAG: cell division protein FtsA [Tannerella sp.]|jgi:cell division protein FtsA|nr:cell division protein FtsA [Tannerella sp.]
MTDYIVAIDLGTSHITGIVGEKNVDGTFSVVSCEMVDSLSSCIHRGNIYNVENTAKQVGRLLKKLESSLKGNYIDRVYVGVGGQSVRTVDHMEYIEIESGEVVSTGDIRMLEEKCGKYKPDLLDVLGVAPAIYYVDGRKEENPVGVPCNRLEARYKIVVGRKSIRRELTKSLSERCGKEIVGIIVSPLALADAMLSNEEKELGCALVDFGAGATSVTVYKNGDLLYSAVIPLGGNLITRDIISLQLTEALSEKLKKEYGCAILKKEDDGKMIKIDMEGDDREISVNDLNAIIEARAKEIVENVYARISEVIDVKSLGYGIVISGHASELKDLPELIQERFKIKVRHSAIRGGLVRGDDSMTGNPLYMTAVSIMLKGTEPCVSCPLAPSEPVVEEDNGSNDENEKEEEKITARRGGFFRSKRNKAKSDTDTAHRTESGNSGDDDKKGRNWGSLFDDLFKES